MTHSFPSRSSSVLQLGSSERELARTRSGLDDARDRLNAAFARLEVEQNKLEEALAAIAANRAELEDAYQTIDVDKETIEAQLAELAILKSLRDDLARKLQESEGSLAEQREQIGRAHV